MPDNSKGTHGHMRHGAQEDVDEDGEEGRVDADHRVHARQQAVRHALQYFERVVHYKTPIRPNKTRSYQRDL